MLSYGVRMDDLELSRRFAAIEEQLVRISQHLGVPCPAFPSTAFMQANQPPGAPFAAPTGGPPAMPAYQVEVMALLRAGNKLQAIKVFREATGAGLREAMDAVERLEQ